MNNIAAILDDLSLSQNSYNMIKSFNSLSNNENNVCCFYHNVSAPPVEPLFSVMNIYYLNHFKGDVIATNLQTLQTLLNLNTKVNKYLYLWDLEWLRNPYDFMQIVDLLRTPELKIIARSESHATLIENYTNKKVKRILDDWNPHQLLEIINGRKLYYKRVSSQ